MPVLTRDISAAAAALKQGKLVAFPTETVYGLGAIANNAAAVDKIYRVKQRPRGHPLIVHLRDAADAAKWARDIPPAAARLLARFMPGPLTVLLPARDHARHLIGDSNLIGVRVPAHPLAQALLAAVGDAVAAPSANRYTALSPTTADHVIANFPAEEELIILRGDDCSIGIESTIVGFVGNRPYIARPGDISADAVAQLCESPLAAAPPTTRAPGFGVVRHYAPQTPLTVVPADALSAFCAARPDAAALSRRRPDAVPTHRWRQAAADAKGYAQRLYRYLYELDAVGAARIVVEAPPRAPEWEAVRDRLSKAAAAAD